MGLEALIRGLVEVHDGLLGAGSRDAGGRRRVGRWGIDHQDRCGIGANRRDDVLLFDRGDDVPGPLDVDRLVGEGLSRGYKGNRICGRSLRQGVNPGSRYGIRRRKADVLEAVRKQFPHEDLPALTGGSAQRYDRGHADDPAWQVSRERSGNACDYHRRIDPYARIFSIAQAGGPHAEFICGPAARVPDDAPHGDVKDRIGAGVSQDVNRPHSRFRSRDGVHADGLQLQALGVTIGDTPSGGIGNNLDAVLRGALNDRSIH